MLSPVVAIKKLQSQAKLGGGGTGYFPSRSKRRQTQDRSDSGSQREVAWAQVLALLPAVGLWANDCSMPQFLRL